MAVSLAVPIMKADAIIKRYNEKKRIVQESKQTLDHALHVPLVNFIFHLDLDKKIVFRDWVCLNQAVYDELGVESGGLRALTQD